MKAVTKLGIFVALGASLFMSSCVGEYYVSDQPADVVYERGGPPFAGAVWIGDDWVWSGGHYVHNRGHWEHTRQGHTYVKGSWHKGPKGYAWHKGRWQ
jgi:hypothetical protein